MVIVILSVTLILCDRGVVVESSPPPDLTPTLLDPESEFEREFELEFEPVPYSEAKLVLEKVGFQRRP